MKKSQALNQLRSELKRQKRQKTKTNAVLRKILRLKALIAFYKGNNKDSVASCYDVSVKSLSV